MHNLDQQSEISAAVVEAARTKKPIQITGSDSKSFYGNASRCVEKLSLKQHCGIVDYEPAELFITARGGTPLTEIEAELDKHNQMLPFEPPHYGKQATIGGTIACGFSGPRRPYAGAARDCILGSHIINGKGEYLRFGGQVMKNVAGYDIARSMCGALGTLGIIMQVSIRVLPKPRQEITIVIDHLKSAKSSLELLQFALLSNLAISASCADNQYIYLRINSTLSVVEQVFRDTALEQLEQPDPFWLSIKEQQHPFFRSNENLWRITVPNNTPRLDLQGDTLYEWNGGLRWLTSNESNVHQVAKQKNGHAILFKTRQPLEDRFPTLPAELKQLHLNIKQAFDPDNILNPGRMYSWC